MGDGCRKEGWLWERAVALRGKPTSKVGINYSRPFIGGEDLPSSTNVTLGVSARKSRKLIIVTLREPQGPGLMPQRWLRELSHRNPAS